MNGTMKAQVYYEPGKMQMEQIPIPAIEPDEVLVKVKAVGICGSDIAYYFGGSPLETPDGKGPLVLGHEFAGEIVEIGEKVKKSGLFQVGDRVLGNPVIQCNACDQCAKTNVNLCRHKRTKGVSENGAFSEYTAMPCTHVYKIPDGVSYEEAALCEPFACACYGIQKLDIKLGDTVVIFGPGSIGLMQLQLAKRSGAGKIIMVGVLDQGLNKALELGADVAVNTLDTQSPYYSTDLVKTVENSLGGLADRVIVATAAQSALQDALKVSGSKANIVYFGLPSDKTILEVPLLDLMINDKSLLVSWQAPYTWDTALKILKSKGVSLEELITHRYPLEGLAEGIELMHNPAVPDKIKAVVVFD